MYIVRTPINARLLIVEGHVHDYPLKFDQICVQLDRTLDCTYFFFLQNLQFMIASQVNPLLSDHYSIGHI